MAILKVIELLASSNKSWEQATANAVKEASKTIKNIRSVYVNEQSAVVTGDTRNSRYLIPYSNFNFFYICAIQDLCN